MLRRYSSSFLLLHHNPLVFKNTMECSLRSFRLSIGRQRSAFSSIIVASHGISEVVQKSEPTSSSSSTFRMMVYSSSASTPLIELSRRLRVRPSPELGLLSLLFVLSTAIGAIFSLAIMSIPTMTTVRRLAASIDKLSKVVSEEVPVTLSSLKLSSLEINDLTQQLTNLRIATC